MAIIYWTRPTIREMIATTYLSYLSELKPSPKLRLSYLWAMPALRLGYP